MKRQICFATTLLALCSVADAFAPLARNAAIPSWRLPAPASASPLSQELLANLRSSSSRSSTALQMAVNPAAIAAIGGAITGGLFAGSLHAVAGELKKIMERVRRVLRRFHTAFRFY
jgi:hypothetical protein